MGIHSWIAIIALFFYLTPMGRLLGRPLRAVLGVRAVWPLPPLLVKIGRWEYLLGPLRDRLLSLLLLGLMVYYWIADRPLSRDILIASSLIIFYNLLAILTIRHRDGVRLKLGELARVNSNIHPEDFFNLYYVMLSPWPPAFPYEGFRLVPFNDADFQTGDAPVRKFTPVLEAVMSTNTLARIAFMAYKQVGPEHGKDAFDACARLWGSRLSYIFKMRLHTTLVKDPGVLEGRTLLVFNHQSTLDFGLNFFALGDLRARSTDAFGPGTRHLRPRFIAAKDHFIDNPFVYSWISVGKLIENAGMIFIERKKKGMGWLAMQEAAEKLTRADVEIAVYPQGTRAYPLYSSSGHRMDAGFYTTFKKKTWKSPLGHLKPGTAHLILDSLIALKKQGQDKLNILLVGIKGAGIAGPKGRWIIQTQADIEYRVAPLWAVSTELAEGISAPQTREPQNEAEQRYFDKIEEIQKGLNDRLIEVMEWHKTLSERLGQELPRLDYSPEAIQEMERTLQGAQDRQDPLPFVLLDRIFSLKPDQWKRFLDLWNSIKDQETGSEAFQGLLQEVSEKLIK